MFQALRSDTAPTMRSAVVVAAATLLAALPLLGMVQELSELDETLPEVVAAVSADVISRANCAIVS